MLHTHIPIRLSHILRYCTVGSVIRGPEYLMTPKDIRDWTDRNGRTAARLIPYVDQVRSALGIAQELREPPIASELENGMPDGICIPALRFPSWMRCPAPRCGRLYCRPWRDSTQSSWQCVCDKHPDLEQVPWVFVHPDGHMADVPWHRLTHANAVTRDQKQCRPDWNTAYIRLIEHPGSKYELICERCRARAGFHTGIRNMYGKLRRQPWLAESVEEEDLEHHNEPAQVLTVNDTRVHSPQTITALVIPPESRIRRGSLVDRLYTNSRIRKEIDRSLNPLQKKSILWRLADEFRCKISDVEKAIADIDRGYPSYGQHLTPGLLLEKEYQALTDPIPDLFDDEDFVTCHYTDDLEKMNLEKDSQPWRIKSVLAQVTAVTRLKEILVLKGFQRLGGTLVPPDIIGEADWLPALELYGDGIFFRFNEAFLNQWEQLSRVEDRIQPLQRRFERSGIRFDPDVIVSPRFILLHTISHLLIRQLEAQAGYPAASLKERIYSKPGKDAMAGILIYVAVPDVEGSLGGLCELADPKRFLRLMCKVFDHAQWCSLDPVCSQHEGQGPNLLNRAACHACVLIPEPGCAYGNTLLDRTLVNGGDNGPSFV
ncbi:MAG: DUF1998 domain-containing protein [Desulfobacterales bacterium]|nr:DUF1998 domain-containing protein [Desulfobacterales bacterium]